VADDQGYQGATTFQSLSDWQSLKRGSKNGGYAPFVDSLTLACSPGGIFQVCRTDFMCSVAVVMINPLPGARERWPMTRAAGEPLHCNCCRTGNHLSGSARTVDTRHLLIALH
jgi:hypothetical protein